MSAKMFKKYFCCWLSDPENGSLNVPYKFEFEMKIKSKRSTIKSLQSLKSLKFRNSFTLKKARKPAKQLEEALEECKIIRKKFDDMEEMKKKIQRLKQSVISEIRSYGSPPDGVHQVMMATYILLGERKGDLKVSIFLVTILREQSFTPKNTFFTPKNTFFYAKKLFYAKTFCTPKNALVYAKKTFLRQNFLYTKKWVT